MGIQVDNETLESKFPTKESYLIFRHWTGLVCLKGKNGIWLETNKCKEEFLKMIKEKMQEDRYIRNFQTIQKRSQRGNNMIYVLQGTECKVAGLL